MATVATQIHDHSNPIFIDKIQNINSITNSAETQTMETDVILAVATETITIANRINKEIEHKFIYREMRMPAFITEPEDDTIARKNSCIVENYS